MELKSWVYVVMVMLVLVGGVFAATTCTETDGGSDAYVSGTTTLTNPDGSIFNTGVDSCSDSDTVKEFSCDRVHGGWNIEYLDCRSGYLCYLGACTPRTCSETDSGRNIYTKGTATIKNPDGTTFNSLSDSCRDSDTLTEITCDGNGWDIEYIDCPSSYSCSDGACVRVSSARTCSETDRGDNIYLKGQNTIYNSDSTVFNSISDVCMNSTTVMEATCTSDGGWRLAYETCPSSYSCSDGACKVSSSTGYTDVSCVNSGDRGDDVYTKGTVTYSYKYDGVPHTSTFTDYCKNSSTVVENFCVSTTPNIWDRQCPSGYSCSDGACKSTSTSSSDTCTETDGGKNYYVAGSATGKLYASGVQDTWSDSCTVVLAGAETDSSSYIKEFWCQDNKVYLYYDTCPSGYTCHAGACVVNTTSTTTGSTVTFEVGLNNYPDTGSYSESTAISGWINSYKVTPVSPGVYSGVLIDTKKTTPHEAAAFVVYPVENIDFIGFKSYAAARAATAWTFTYPPYKNFGDVSDQLCQINYLDTSSKLRISDGSYSCAVSLSVPYQPSNLTDSDSGTDTGSTSGGTSTPTNATETPPTPPSEAGSYSYSVELKRGWNLVSAPLKATDSVTSSAFVSATTCSAPKFYVYDAATNSYITSGYGLNVGDKVPVPNAFWVKVSAPCKIGFTGDYLQAYDTSWRPREGSGWIAIGGPYSSISWSDVSGSCTILSGPWQFDNSENSWKKATVLKPGEGYFVKVGASCVLGSDVPPLPPS